MQLMNWSATALGFFCAVAMWPVLAANDEDNYKGDTLRYSHRVYGKEKDPRKADNTPEDKAPTLCFPAKTDFRGLGREKDDLIVRVRKPDGDFWSQDGLFSFMKSDEKKREEAMQGVTDCDGKETLFTDRKYVIENGLAAGSEPDRYGFTYGALVVPYKYHFNGSKSFNGNGTVAPFVGYRRARNNIGVSLKLVGFLGASVIEVTREDEEGESKKESLAGLSYGGGVIAVLKNDFQMGLVLGEDRVSKDSDYEDDGKLWGAVAIGFSFGT